MRRAPAHELVLKHCNQAAGDLSKRPRFRDDLLSANKLVRKINVEGQADLGVTGIQITAIADMAGILELVCADMGLGANADYLRSLPKRVFVLESIHLVLQRI